MQPHAVLSVTRLCQRHGRRNGIAAYSIPPAVALTYVDGFWYIGCAIYWMKEGRSTWRTASKRETADPKAASSSTARAPLWHLLGRATRHWHFTAACRATRRHRCSTPLTWPARWASG